MGRTAVSIPFYSLDIKISRIVSASPDLYFTAAGKTIGQVTAGQRSRLLEFDNGNYVLELENGTFIEWKRSAK